VPRDYQSRLIDDFDRFAARRVRSALVSAVTGSGNTVTLVTLAVASWEPEAGLLVPGAPR
jgi:superfamily II DNA or RNA helicase